MIFIMKMLQKIAVKQPLFPHKTCPYFLQKEKHSRRFIYFSKKDIPQNKNEHQPLLTLIFYQFYF